MTAGAAWRWLQENRGDYLSCGHLEAQAIDEDRVIVQRSDGTCDPVTMTETAWIAGFGARGLKWAPIDAATDEYFD